MGFHKYDSTFLTSTLNSMPLSIFFAGLFGSAITLKPVGAVFSAGFLVNDMIITMLAKKLFQKVGSYNEVFDEKIGVRPDPPSYGCGLFPNCNHDEKKGKSYGFYSGHSSSALFAVTFWILYLWNHTHLDNNSEEKDNERFFKILVSVLLSILALGILWSRIHIGCHSYIQVIVGSAVGAGLGTGFYFLLDRKSNIFNK